MHCVTSDKREGSGKEKPNKHNNRLEMHVKFLFDQVKAFSMQLDRFFILFVFEVDRTIHYTFWTRFPLPWLFIDSVTLIIHWWFIDPAQWSGFIYSIALKRATSFFSQSVISDSQMNGFQTVTSNFPFIAFHIAIF